MTTIARTLATAVEGWLGARPSRSLGMLSRISEVSYSTIRRLTTEAGDISQENAINIASVVMDEQNFRLFIGDHWPVLKKFVADVNYKSAEENNGLTYYLKHKEFSRIIVLASKAKGITAGDVLFKFGQKSEACFEILIDQGILKPTNDGSNRVSFQGDLGNVSFELARKVMADLADEFSQSRVESMITPPQTAWVAWEGLKPEAVRQCNQIFAEAIEKAFKIMNDQDNKGDVLVFMGSLLNVVDEWERF